MGEELGREAGLPHSKDRPLSQQKQRKVVGG